MGTACQRLTAANVPHNLFIADCGARVFLFPNCFAEKKALGLIPEGEPQGWAAVAAPDGGTASAGAARNQGNASSTRWPIGMAPWPCHAGCACIPLA